MPGTIATSLRSTWVELGALILLLAVAWARATPQDRPLPPSPCPSVFSYEGATVDWDRWYGEVLVTTDIPLTGIRLDVWLSRPALALRHNWDGNVTTLDNRRFTILNLYKHIDPGPPKLVRIVVKFDDHKEVPVVKAIELNGRRICSEGDDSRDLSRQTSSDYEPQHEYHSSQYNPSPPPSNGKYDFDRTTRRPIDSSDDHRNIVSKRPPSGFEDARENTRRRPQEDDRVHPATSTTWGQPTFADDFPSQSPSSGHQRPPSGGGKSPGLPRPSEHSEAQPSGSSKPERRPDSSAVAEDDYLNSPPKASYRPAERRRPGAMDEDSVAYEEAGVVKSPPRSRSPGTTGARTTTEEPLIDVRFNSEVQPLTDDYADHSSEAPNEGPTGMSGRPMRQDNRKDPGWVPPGHRRGGDNNSGKGHGNANGPPGLSGNPPPGHGGPVPGHNKNKGNSESNNNYNENYNTQNNNDNGWKPSQEQERYTSTFKPDTSTWKRPVEEQECGHTLTVSPLITHGQNTSRGQWPWHAAIYQNKGTDLKYICGGTLIHPKYVITAAHCVTRSTTGRAVDPDTIIVYLGKYHLHRWTNEEGVQQGKVADILVHPDYNTTDYRGDLALLEFSTALSYTQYVRPVCLWGSHESNELDYVVGQEGFVVGWGYDEHGELTEDLRMATMPIVEQQACIWSYPEFFSRFTNNMTFCAGYKNGTSACNGDSGGGLVLPRGKGTSKIWYLRGLVSTSVAQDGQRVCNTGHYVVFTDLAKYLKWIVRNTH